jgi:hypothetical protein
MTYQDAFVRYLAGEKQPTLEISATEHVNKKPPKDSIYYNFYANSTISSTKTTTPNSTTTTATSAQPQHHQQPAASANNTTTTASSTTTINGGGGGLDKENYYNSSRRENLTPLNSCEYRNSYKDVYDNQGVRVNPAIFKSLPHTIASNATASSSAPNGTTTTSPSSITIVPNNNSQKSSIVITKNQNPVTPQKCDEIIPLSTPPQPSANILADHTYKTTTQSTLGANTNGQKVNQQNNAECSPKSNNNNNKQIHPQSMGGENLDESVLFVGNSLVEATVRANEMEENVQPHHHHHNHHNHQQITDECITFTQGEFLIHKPTFSGDFENYDIWCVLDEQYLQKYEPVLLSTGERCHQSADILAQYNANKDEFLLIKVEEKGKTENENLVVAVLSEYEPRNNEKIAHALASHSG